jgi:hypothetical protein
MHKRTASRHRENPVKQLKAFLAADAADGGISADVHDRDVARHINDHIIVGSRKNVVAPVRRGLPGTVSTAAVP